MKPPCAKQFRNCVDKCKNDDTDFVTVCEDYTSKLLSCTQNNLDYFKEMVPPEEDSSSASAIESKAEQPVEGNKADTNK